MNEQKNTPNISNEYKPITMWGYFGYQILFSIPIIWLILIIIFSFGGPSNINLKNFARSYFCKWIIISIILLILFIMFMIFGTITYTN